MLPALIKNIWGYLPDLEEALLRYALTLTVLIAGLGLLLFAVASGFRMPMPIDGRMRTLTCDPACQHCRMLWHCPMAPRLKALPLPIEAQRQLIPDSTTARLPTHRLSEVLAKLNLGAHSMVRLRRPRTQFYVGVRVDNKDFDVVKLHGYEFTMETSLEAERQFKLGERTHRLEWRMSGNGLLELSLDDKGRIASFDVSDELNASLERTKENQRIAALNAISRQTGGDIIPSPKFVPPKELVYESSGPMGRVRLELRGLRAVWSDGKFGRHSGRGRLLLDKSIFDGK